MGLARTDLPPGSAQILRANIADSYKVISNVPVHANLAQAICDEHNENVASNTPSYWIAEKSGKILFNDCTTFAANIPLEFVQAVVNEHNTELKRVLSSGVVLEESSGDTE